MDGVRSEVDAEIDVVEAGRDGVREILEACEGTIVSLAAQLAIRIDPNYTPHASKSEYQRTLADAVSNKREAATTMRRMRHRCV
jgi:hypothetical protein